MAWVLELVEAGMQEIVAEPSRLLDPNLDMFKPVADEVSEFAYWRQSLLDETVRS